jgi:HK97 family phage prohead protease
MKEYHSYEFKLNDVSDTGQFQGYAAVFGNVDLGNDMVEPGAFEQSLRESGGKIPILDHHNPAQQIGWNLEAHEDAFGLFVRGQLDLNVQAARERHSLMKLAAQIGGRSGLSIGFQTVRDEPDAENFKIRRLKEVRLMEYSLVTFPMNPEAGVTRIKRRSAAGNLLNVTGEKESSGAIPSSQRTPSFNLPSDTLYASLHTLLTHLRAS